MASAWRFLHQFQITRGTELTTEITGVTRINVDHIRRSKRQRILQFIPVMDINTGHISCIHTEKPTFHCSNLGEILLFSLYHFKICIRNYIINSFSLSRQPIRPFHCNRPMQFTGSFFTAHHLQQPFLLGFSTIEGSVFRKCTVSGFCSAREYSTLIFSIIIMQQQSVGAARSSTLPIFLIFLILVTLQ